MLKIFKLNKPLNYIKEWYLNPARRQNQVSLPTVLNFPITDNCNSRCLMCSVWKDKETDELSPAEIKKHFSDPSLVNLKHVGISGGEPSLRKDLVECMEAIVQCLPKLQTISITSHGYHYSRWSRFLPQIAKVTESHDVAFALNLSLDGIGDVHNHIRGIRTAYDRVTKTLTIAKALNVKVELQCTVLKENVYNIGRVLAFARQNSIEVVFRCATTIERLYNADVMHNVALRKNEKSFLSDFFLSELLHSQTTSPGRRLYYKKMAYWLIEGGPRPHPCYFQNEGVLITSKGSVYSCSITDKKLGDLRKEGATDSIASSRAITIRESVKASDCANCIHDQTGAWKPFDLILEQLGRTKTKPYFVTAKKASIATRDIIFGGIDRGLPKSARKHGSKALLIGAYGGEHVGDAAILGGVIMRIVKKYNIEFVTVASFRPHRTSMWLAALDLPIEANVVLNTGKTVSQLLSHVDYIAYAGGPLMELPAQLANHYSVLSKGKRKGAHIIIEGVGLGPIFSFHSKYLVKSIISLGDAISIRTKAHKIKEYISTSQSINEVMDPAFDYLESRSLKVIKNCSSKSEIELLTDNAQIKIAINLRPLWDKYNFRKDLSVEGVENEYLRNLANAMLTLQNEHGRGLDFYFFPMNADQFGMSDLSTAYRLESMLDPSINFSVWEAEPDIDSILFFLQKMDVILAMRFHACIFAMTHCKDRLIGMDYQIGKSGKVAHLFDECGLAENLLSIDRLSSDTVVAQINDKLRSKLAKTKFQILIND